MENLFMVLDDGRTYSTLDGCKIVAVDSGLSTEQIEEILAEEDYVPLYEFGGGAPDAERCFVVEREISDQDNLYVFTHERQAFEFAARYPGACVHVETPMGEGAGAQFLIDTAADARDGEDEFITAAERAAHADGQAGRPDEVELCVYDEERVSERAAYLRGRAGLAVRPGCED
jgi:hypothetical protein